MSPHERRADGEAAAPWSDGGRAGAPCTRPSEEAFVLDLRNHASRAAITEEMHLRTIPRFNSPACVLQIVMLSGEGGTEGDRQHALELCRRHGVEPVGGLRFFSVRLGNVDFVWERHTEFATYTFVREGPPDDGLFDNGLPAEVPQDWLSALPGTVLRATRISVLRPRAPALRNVETAFAADDLVVCDIADSRARICSDFRIHADGFGRLVVIDQGLRGMELARLVQRIQELGNYRNGALLGLPVAQAAGARLLEMERDLAAITQRMTEAGADDRDLLQEIMGLAAGLARLTSETGYRMSASRAYAQLAYERLAALRVVPVDAHQALTDFTERRFCPAVRTCESFSLRLSDLSTRTLSTSALLRTRVETRLATQHRDLLSSMDRRTGLQLQLQQTVEGLSAVAISYYVYSLLRHVAEPAFESLPPSTLTLINSCAVAAVGMVVWLSLRVVRRRTHSPATLPARRRPLSHLGGSTRPDAPDPSRGGV